MNKYEVKAEVCGNSVKIRRHFKSRNAAIDYMLRVYSSNLNRYFEIECERQVSKHNIEYIGDHSNRFFVNRIHN